MSKRKRQNKRNSNFLLTYRISPPPPLRDATTSKDGMHLLTPKVSRGSFHPAEIGIRVDRIRAMTPKSKRRRESMLMVWSCVLVRETGNGSLVWKRLVLFCFLLVDGFCDGRLIAAKWRSDLQPSPHRDRSSNDFHLRCRP